MVEQSTECTFLAKMGVDGFDAGDNIWPIKLNDCTTNEQTDGRTDLQVATIVLKKKTKHLLRCRCVSLETKIVFHYNFYYRKTNRLTPWNWDIFEQKNETNLKNN